MIFRFLLTVVIAVGLSAFVEAGSIRVNFSAELDRHHAALDPVTSVRGHFIFDETPATGRSDIFGDYLYSDLLEFALEIPGGHTVLTNEGIILAIDGDRPPGVLNRPATARSLYRVLVGAVNYPQEAGDLYEFSLGVPTVWKPVVEIDLSPPPGTVIALDGLHLPSIDSVFHPELVLHHRQWDSFGERDYTATYRLTSLIVVPEPGSWLLVLLGVGFAEKSPAAGGNSPGIYAGVTRSPLPTTRAVYGPFRCLEQKAP